MANVRRNAVEIGEEGRSGRGPRGCTGMGPVRRSLAFLVGVAGHHGAAASLPTLGLILLLNIADLRLLAASNNMLWYPSQSKKPLYRVISRLSDSDDEVKIAFKADWASDSSAGASSHRNVIHSRTPWILSTVIFALSTTALLLHIHAMRRSSFESGFSTDFAGVRPHISTLEVTFTGSPSFSDDGDEYVEPMPGVKIYVGEPSPEIDNNWRQLTENRYFLLTAAEAEAAWGEDYVEFWDEERGGYLAGLDMFHTLHCLDHLRQGFYPEHYPQTPIHGVIHRDHCIDHLRQMVMCYGDVTPIPTRFYPGIARNYIDSDRRHTCRDFGAIREWTTERFFESRLIEEHRQ